MQCGGRTGSPGRPPLLFAAVLAVLIALALAAPAAEARGSYWHITCAVGPGVAGQTNVESIQGDLLSGGGWDSLQLLDSDTGGFTFSGPATCSGIGVSATGPKVLLPTAVTITATGTYDNLVCGTGTAGGNATLTGPGINLVSPFALTFVSGAGKLSFSNPTGTIGSDDINGGDGSGYVEIVPTGSPGGTNPCVNGNVTSFTVLGGFEATLTG